MTGRRIAGGTDVDRDRPIPFVFDGRDLTGYEGDTLASALLASGVRVVGRSFKYRRPRGIWGAWTEEPNALFDVTVDGRTTPNRRATTEPLRPGLSAAPINAGASGTSGGLGLLDRLAPFIPAAFYYKTFMWPHWRLFEPAIRAMAGLGRVDPEHEPPADSPQLNAACDVLVVGAGPAGLAAARAAALAGGRVILADDQRRPGGSLLHRGGAVDGMPAEAWIAACLSAVIEAGGEILSGSTVFGLYDHGLAGLWQRRSGSPDALWRIRANRIVVAAGAIERPLVFPDNDRPGVMSAEAALVYLQRYGVLVGERVVVATNNDRAYDVGTTLAAAGADVTIIDTRSKGPARADGLRRMSAAVVTGVAGARGVTAVRVGTTWLDADALLVSGGLTPTVHLFCQAGGRLRYDPTLATLAPRSGPDHVAVCGAANGAFDLDAALQQGHAAGGGPGASPRATAFESPFRIAAAWPDMAPRRRQWVDLQSDVTAKDVQLAARENFRSVEHLKRYTTLGMATDQGKTSNLNGLAALAAVTGRSIDEVGTTTFRPPYVPVPMKVLAGRRRADLYAPVRRLPLEAEHREAGATFREYGGWLRPAWYGAAPEAEAVATEARRARETVGLFDGSPLGKIEVFGPEAAALIDFCSYGTMSTLKPGRIRYGFLLTEKGIVYDDGVVLRLADDHWIVSCSSGHVAGVRMHLEEWRQDRFDPRKVVVVNATEQWATLTATGPLSRQLVAGLNLGVDLRDDALPHMAWSAGRFENAPARVARVSFTGDRSYEISVPASAAGRLWHRMRAVGAGLDAVPIGLEALLLLRAEKGYLIVGKDTDGHTMPHDLGVTGPREKRTTEFVGRRSLFTDDACRSDRRQLVGLQVPPGAPPLAAGAHAIEVVAGRKRSIGYVTSSYASPTLGVPVALGLVEQGRDRFGEEIAIYHLGARFRAKIVDPCALDPDGRRLHA